MINSYAQLTFYPCLLLFIGFMATAFTYPQEAYLWLGLSLLTSGSYFLMRMGYWWLYGIAHWQRKYCQKHDIKLEIMRETSGKLTVLSLACPLCEQDQGQVA